MSVTDQYIRGISLYSRQLYAESEKELSAIAGGGDLLGRMARYYLGRCLRARAIQAAGESDFDAALKHIGLAAEAVGPTAELAGYLAGIYARTISPPRDARQSDPAEAAADAAVRGAHAGMSLQALMALQTAIRRYGDSARLHLVTGMILAGEDRLSDARRHFLQAAQRDCSCYEAYRYLGLCDASEGKFAPALSHLMRAMSLRPADLLGARETLAVARAAAAEGLTVRVAFAEEVGTPSESDLDRLAELILTESDFAAAPLALPAGETDDEVFGVFSDVMGVVLARHGDYADMQHHQAKVQQRLGRPQRALTHVLKALAINPAFVQARFMAGSLLLETDPVAAAEHLRCAVAAGGDYADVRAALGTAYARLGRPAAARSQLRRSLEINSSYTPAADALKRLVA